jgi:hypothetical protein
LREPIGWSLLLALLLVGIGIYLVNRVPAAPPAEALVSRPSRGK